MSATTLLLNRLREECTTEIYHEQGVGFLARDEWVESRKVPRNPEGEKAARLIERLLQYVSHDLGCPANDLDPLDDSPCTCGLRALYNPAAKGPPTPEPTP